jgi:hypothetical protein
VGADMKIVDFLKKRNMPFVSIDGTASDDTINIG